MGHRADALFVPEGLRGDLFPISSAFFDTFSFQAPEFYKQHGYRVFGELKDFPPDHTRYYMTKQL
jgi:hypothetical protein